VRQTIKHNMLLMPIQAVILINYVILVQIKGGSVAEWLACWTHAQKGLGSNRSRDVVG